jgi:hypothetical protein
MEMQMEMAMDDGPYIRLRIPDPEDFEDLDRYTSCSSVPAHLVDYGIDVLQCVLAQWKADQGLEPDARMWGVIVPAAGQVLGGLLDTYTTHHTQHGARRLVGQVAAFCGGWRARGDLEALRDRQEDRYIVDALLALHEESERRRKERMQQREDT